MSTAAVHDQLFTFAVPEIGYGECRIDKAIKWRTGAVQLLTAAALGVAIWWFSALKWVGLLKVPACLLALWQWLRYYNPLLYESVAVKQGRGVELCTRWRHCERSVVIPIKDLLTVTLQEVADQQMRLTFKLGNGTSYPAFEHCETAFEDHLTVLACIAGLLPRQTIKKKALSLLKTPTTSTRVQRWAGRLWRDQRDFAIAVWRGCSQAAARWRLNAFFACMRRYNRARQSERWQRAAAALQPTLAACQAGAAAAQRAAAPLLAAASVQLAAGLKAAMQLGQQAWSACRQHGWPGHVWPPPWAASGGQQGAGGSRTTRSGGGAGSSGGGGASGGPSSGSAAAGGKKGGSSSSKNGRKR